VGAGGLEPRSGRRPTGRTAHDLTDVNPVVQNPYRGPHGSLNSRAVWSAQSA